jgi:hypothetical protein
MKDYFTIGMSLKFCASWERFLECHMVVDLAVDTEDLLFIFGYKRLSAGIYRENI